MKRNRDFFRFLALLFALAMAQTMWAQGQGPIQPRTGTVARPRPDAEAAKPPVEEQKIESRFKRQPDSDIVEEGATFRSDVLTVDVPIAVLDNKGRFIPNIPPGNFRILEDGVPQKVTGFELGQAPMTVCLVIEFSAAFQRFWSETWYQTLVATQGFIETLQPEDYLAIVAYDLRPEILSDFSTNRMDAMGAMRRLQIPAFSESNLYDALQFTLERMENIEGRKAVIVIASGMDTFSKLNFGEARKVVQNAGIPIYTIGLMQWIREWMDSRNMMGPIMRMDFLQADNQMRTFAKESGGQSFFPRFYGEFPSIYGAIHQAMRNQYNLIYQPTNQERNGAFRRIEVQLVNPATGEPLRVVDEKGKPIKYSIVAKRGYNAPRPVE
ncbi:MAG: VWA domain-containing protein [Bryobacterales bacterium]|jgi:VWFA-related protein|nr:VWA domain-containing protein [Bryobacterales bacterium]